MKFNPKVPIESVFDINTDPQIWNPIVGFRGYEVSDKGNIRSLKFYKDYPYGILLSPCNKKNEYILSDNNNVRRKVSINDIYKMRDTSSIGYTNTICNGLNTRTQRYFINFETVRFLDKPGSGIYRIPVHANRDELVMPSFGIIGGERKMLEPARFTIIDDDGKKIINPITFYDSFNL